MNQHVEKKGMGRWLSAVLIMLLLIGAMPFVASASVTENVPFMSELTIDNDTIIAGNGVDWTVTGENSIQGCATSLLAENGYQWIRSEGSITLTNTSGQDKMLEISFEKSSAATLTFIDSDGSTTEYYTAGTVTTVYGLYSDASFAAGERLTIKYKNENSAVNGKLSYVYLTDITLAEAGKKTVSFLPDPVPTYVRTPFTIPLTICPDTEPPF